MAIESEAIVSADCQLQFLDTLYRFGAGVDTNDSGLLKTSLSQDAIVDFRPCGRRMGLDFSILNGAETIIQFLIASSKTQITSHVITNGRAYMTGGAATLQSLVDATHILRRDESQRCQMRNWYHAELVELEGGWRIRRLTIDNVWFTGDPQVLSGK